MNASRRAAIAGWMLTIVASTAAGAPVTDANAVTQAVWKTQSMDFEYRSNRTRYNCSALQDKLRQILMSVGVHHGVLVRPYSCIGAIGIARFQVTLQSPVPATEENVRELTSYDTTEQLTARLRGEQLYTADELPRFPAEWKTVSFARDRQLRLTSGDCELVQQLRHQVLARLSVNVLNEIHCSMMSRDLGPPRLTVSALVAVAIADGHAH